MPLHDCLAIITGHLLTSLSIAVKIYFNIMFSLLYTTSPSHFVTAQYLRVLVIILWEASCTCEPNRLWFCFRVLIFRVMEFRIMVFRFWVFRVLITDPCLLWHRHAGDAFCPIRLAPLTRYARNWFRGVRLHHYKTKHIERRYCKETDAVWRMHVCIMSHWHAQVGCLRSKV